MSLQRFLIAAGGLVLITTSVVSAQQTPSTPTPGSESINSPRTRQEGARRRRMKTQGRMSGKRKMAALTRLNITEEQRQLNRGIRERNLAATKAQREQLAQMRQRRMEGSLSDEDRARFQSLRREMRASMQSMRSEMRNTLNEEQRSQLDAMREQRKQRREEFMNRREEFRRTRPAPQPIQP
ncbi:MAG: hypothetical protein DMF69_07970 [Acidobacteria bacterium]|nr:MAG: hypothetical protein DMF69_07970 [Acidobacteriota bacterium]